MSPDIDAVMAACYYCEGYGPRAGSIGGYALTNSVTDQQRHIIEVCITSLYRHRYKYYDRLKIEL